MYCWPYKNKQTKTTQKQIQRCHRNRNPSVVVLREGREGTMGNHSMETFFEEFCFELRRDLGLMEKFLFFKMEGKPYFLLL